MLTTLRSVSFLRVAENVLRPMADGRVWAVSDLPAAGGGARADKEVEGEATEKNIVRRLWCATTADSSFYTLVFFCSFDLARRTLEFIRRPCFVSAPLSAISVRYVTASPCKSSIVALCSAELCPASLFKS